MSSGFITSYVALWILVLVSLVLTILLYRQYGLTLMSGSERINLRGLDIGATPSPLLLSDPEGRPLEVSWSATGPESNPSARVAVFAEPMCPICAGLLENGAEMSELASKWTNVQFLWVDGRAPEADRHPGGWTVAVSDEGPGSAMRAMQIPAYPFAYVVTQERIAAKGLVNVTDDIEALIQSVLGSHPPRSRSGDPELTVPRRAAVEVE